jgi:phospholipase/lecithinase/hemolysin
MQKQILGTGFFLLFFMLPLRTLAASFDRIYVFGDSLSDIGNAFNATGGAVPPNPPYYQGRFSNGPVWVEYLATDLGATATNFSFGGATTGYYGEQPGNPTPTLTGLQQQIDIFMAANPSADPNALYIVWAGSVDYLFGGATNPTEPVANLSTAVTSLAAVGAKNIMVVNLPPNLEKPPGTPVDSQISSSLNPLIEMHNSALTATLDFLSQNSDTNIIPLDVNSLFNRAIANPGAFGFTNVTNSCLVGLVACDNPDKFLFWDDIHPTTAAHELVGELAVSALKPNPVPEPSAELGLLALGGLGAVSLRKSKLKNQKLARNSSGKR